ncbi:hypothetical protein BLJ79_01735 [Arthrobacter sp. UCD-GKA]|uniref:HNH endonuclease signature motif containing protein n=1 Tax=Arthrobacter sp. UCD-GKA TaxID=1913576 RepID=UPI0008DDB29D|nr:HNH endonuclease signature motif containing protein [Arthrobacter sp. UCD-GKA]OIH86709.1 hypothetical protein BLJ79_01735 [Arthrobacter sp. UCD-GKA]
MTTTATLATAGLAGLQQILAPSTKDLNANPSATTVDEKLRLLAVLNSMQKILLDDVAHAVSSSPARSVFLALLTEDLARTAGRAQIVEAGKLEETEAHTLREEPLALLHEAHRGLAAFIGGSISLPGDHRNAPGTKMLFKDATDLLKDQLHLSFAQAKHRVIVHDLLLPRAGFNGAVLPPHFGQLASVFNDGSADPHEVALAARRMLALQPGIDAQQDPAATAESIEQQLAESLEDRNPSGTAQLFKRISAELDASALERSEAEMEAHIGLRYKGKQPRGFIWELCTDLRGHAMLQTLSDQLSNPRSAFGRDTTPPDGEGNGQQSGESSGEQPELPGLSNESLFPVAPPVPAWAVDPDMPEDQRPRAGFADVGRPGTAEDQMPGLQLQPGEAPAAARERLKARSLLRFLFDSARFVADGDQEASPDLPMRPNVELIVTISWDSLIGKLNDPGLTSHNHLVSAGYARRLACSANVIPAVLGTESQPLDLGRTQRFFNRAQRRAMMLRDIGCINPGCSMAGHRCEANHIKPWYLGGETNLANSALLCPACHASFHAGHFKIVVVNSIPYVLQNKALDPEQRLRRNWIFHPSAKAIG